MNYKISLIIPAYNEENRLHINEFTSFAKANPSIQIVFVNDGSTDNTKSFIETSCKNYPSIFLLDLEKNQGKANAVRMGMLWAFDRVQSDYYLFLDADLSTPLKEVFLLLNEIESDEKLKMVFGSRILKIGSTIDRKSYRHYMGRIIATFISMQLGLSIYDTQCGAKLFKAELVPLVFSDAFTSKWLFDVEIFNRLIQHFTRKEVLTLIKEIPLTEWKDIDGSKLGFIDVLKTPFDLLKIALKYK